MLVCYSVATLNDFAAWKLNCLFHITYHWLQTDRAGWEPPRYHKGGRLPSTGRIMRTREVATRRQASPHASHSLSPALTLLSPSPSSEHLRPKNLLTLCKHIAEPKSRKWSSGTNGLTSYASEIPPKTQNPLWHHDTIICNLKKKKKKNWVETGVSVGNMNAKDQMPNMICRIPPKTPNPKPSLPPNRLFLLCFPGNIRGFSGKTWC